MNNLFHDIGYIGTKLTPTRVTFLEKVLMLLDGQMTEPTLYGWFHWLCLLSLLGACVLVGLKAKQLSDKQFDVTLGLITGLLLILEVYKQLNHAYNCEEDSWAFNWRIFPFQFCSTPMYVIALAVLIKKQSIRDSLYCFLATYGLFAGAGVMLYPATVFTETIGINFQTMIHHGAMVVVAVMLYASGKVPLSHKTALRGIPVFLILVALALIMNLLYGQFGNPDYSFNMFFISPYGEGELPVFTEIQEAVPYPIFLSLYIISFTIAAFLMPLLAHLFHKAMEKIDKKKTAQ